jgi:hypothetical protein
MSDERLDRLIDEVARQMTDRHPSSDFRARVIANLDRRPVRVWRPIWILVPLGTLAVAVLVVFLARPFPPSQRLWRTTAALGEGGQGVKKESGFGETRKPDASSQGTTVREVGSARDTAAHATQDVVAGSTFVRARAGGRSNDLSDAAAAVAALAPPRLDLAPLAVDAIGVERLAGEPIAVRQLDTIAPIAVDPIGSR